MMKRLSFFIAATAILAAAFTSCLGENNDVDKKISETAKITRFSLKGNSIVEKCSFTVDQDSLLIYNADSLDMNASLDSLYAVINPTFHKVYINDTIDMYMFDTLWLNFEDNQFTFKVVAADKKTNATYRLQINKHTVDPDTMIWEGRATQVFRGVTTCERAVYLNEKLVYMGILNGAMGVYTSTDGKTWKEESVSGLPVEQSDADLRHAVTAGDKLYITVANNLYQSSNGWKWETVETEGNIDRLLFYMNEELYAVTTGESGQNLVRLTGNKRWENVTALPYDFPTRGEAIAVYPGASGAYRAFVVGGIDAEGNFMNSIWSTENCTYWSNLSSGSKTITPHAYSAIAQYANNLILVGGRDKDGNILQEELTSKDFGLNWTSTKGTKNEIPSLYVRRYDHSIVIPGDGTLFLIGGRASDDTSISDVWYGLNYASLPGFKS